MILDQNTEQHIGKVVKAIRGDGTNSLDMCRQVTIEFTDGTCIVLAPDWYGQECYISQRTPEE
jgi:hypothetical protein